MLVVKTLIRFRMCIQQMMINFFFNLNTQLKVLLELRLIRGSFRQDTAPQDVTTLMP